MMFVRRGNQGRESIGTPRQARARVKLESSSFEKTHTNIGLSRLLGQAMIFPRVGIALLLGVCAASTARAHEAEDLPSREALGAMVRQITSKPVPTAITFHPRSGATDSACRLEPARIDLTRNGSTARSFSVLVDHVSGADA